MSLSRSLLTLAPILILAASAQAGWKHERDSCPPTRYSCLHYWLPQLYRVCCHCEPKRYGQVDEYPHVPIHVEPQVFPCREVSPADYPYAGLPPGHSLEVFINPRAPGGQIQEPDVTELESESPRLPDKK